MAGDEKDEMPMLSDSQSKSSDRNFDFRLQTFASRTRSASMSITMNSTDSFEPEANLVGLTGPLRNERRTQFLQMSGPLYSNRKPDHIFRRNQGVTGVNLVETKAEKFPSFSGMDQNDWLDDRYEAKNEHLLRSGQLGMCNDPYCTTCPTYYKATRSKHSKSSGIFDPKVLFLLTLLSCCFVLMLPLFMYFGCSSQLYKGITLHLAGYFVVELCDFVDVPFN